MSLFARFAGLFAKQDRMLSAAVYLRSGTYFIVTIHGCDGGAPCISAGPVDVRPLASSHEEIGNAIVSGLKRSTHDFPYPANKEQWAQVTAPLLSAAGCRSWGAFARLASCLRVNQAAQQLQVLPSRRQKDSFVPIVERELKIEMPSAQELGRLVASELELAAGRDTG
jgi:hypothetical protein